MSYGKPALANSSSTRRVAAIVSVVSRDGRPFLDPVEFDWRFDSLCQPLARRGLHNASRQRTRRSYYES